MALVAAPPAAQGKEAAPLLSDVRGGADLSEAKKWEEVVDKEPVSHTSLFCSWMTADPGLNALPHPEVTRYDIPSVRDAFVLDGILTHSECADLIRLTEASGFSFWNPLPNAASDFRSAYTLECANHHPLASLLWSRIKDHVVKSLSIGVRVAIEEISDESTLGERGRPNASDEGREDDRLENDLVGHWDAVGVNENVLFARYRNGGHFGPHSDGSTVLNMNRRTLFSVILYLNDPEEGGDTLILDNEQRDKPIPKDTLGRYRSEPRYVRYAVKPRRGRALLFYQTQMHEGAAVGQGSEKYILRTDIVYERNPPILTSAEDVEAFSLWQEAQLLAEKGHLKKAETLFRKCFKLSTGLADLYGM